MKASKDRPWNMEATAKAILATLIIAMCTTACTNEAWRHRSHDDAKRFETDLAHCEAYAARHASLDIAHHQARAHDILTRCMYERGYYRVRVGAPTNAR